MSGCNANTACENAEKLNIIHNSYTVHTVAWFVHSYKEVCYPKRKEMLVMMSTDLHDSDHSICHFYWCTDPHLCNSS